jgi:hypothetical protein
MDMSDNAHLSTHPPKAGRVSGKRLNLALAQSSRPLSAWETGVGKAVRALVQMSTLIWGQSTPSCTYKPKHTLAHD